MTHPARDTPRLSVVVCTEGRTDTLPACLASLAAQAGEAGAEVIVVENAADEAAWRAFEASGALSTARVVSSRPLGLSRARNLGVAEARAPLAAFIDDDAEAAPGWMQAAVDALARDPACVCVGGPVAPIWPEARPGWLDPSLDGFYTIVDRGPAPRALAAHEWLAGTNIAFRRDALLAEGGFDERLGRGPGGLLGNEEIALLRRFHAQGLTVLYDPAMAVRHRVHAERLDRLWLRRRVAWQAISDLLAEPAGPDDPARLWARIAASLAGQAPHFRNLLGLTRDLDDPRDTAAQMGAIEATIRLLAGVGGGVEAALLAKAP